VSTGAEISQRILALFSMIPQAQAPKRNLFSPPSGGLFGLETTAAVPQFGVRRTMPESTWLRKKAADGGAVASVALGKYYRTGGGVKENKYAARTWYQRASKNRDPNGQHAYGMSILKGEGGQRDIAVGATYLADACANGNTLALEAWSKLEFD